MPLTVDRDGTIHDLEIPFRPACYHAGYVYISDSVNAFADMRRMVFFTGLLRFVKSDDELAGIMGHELAHNVLEHTIRTYRAYEHEADYLGVYLAARAGYDPRGSKNFHLRVCLEHFGRIPADSSFSHGSCVNRAAAEELAAIEIEKKIERREPLLPEPRR